MPSNPVSSSVDSVTRFAAIAPQWAAVILIVGFFLTYLWQHEQNMAKISRQNEIVAVQRIEQCHAIQERSLVVMDKISAAMREHDNTIRDLGELIRNLQDESKRTAEVLDRMDRQ